jgi:predicted nucleic acid-binding protein
VRAAYLDSSVVLRVVLGQPDNLAALLPDLEPFTSALTQVECLRALDRLRFADPSLSDALVDKWAGLARVFGSLAIVQLGPRILSHAAQPLPLPLATLDALHLATAGAVRERRRPDVAFATHDRQLGRAAAAVGFEVVGV